MPSVGLTAKLGPEAARNGRNGTSNLNMSHFSQTQDQSGQCSGLL